MKILNELTIKNLKLNKKRTIVTIIGIILSTALMVGIGLLFSTFQDYMKKEVMEYSGSYHALYGDISSEKLELLDEKEVSYFYEKGIGFSKIESDNEYKPYLYISEVNRKYFDELKLVDGRFPLNDSEIVISNHISSNGGVTYKVGDSVTLEYGYREFEGEKIYNNDNYVDGEKLVTIGTKTYKVVGTVERSKYEDYSASGYSVFTLNEDVNGNINLFVIFNKKSKIMKQAKDLASTLGYDTNFITYNSSLLMLYGESGYSNITSSIMGMMVIMLSLVSIGCIIVIYNSFAISVMERKKEFGLLSSIGTTKKQLSYTVFFEAAIVGIIGIILGIGGAYIGIGTVICVLNNLLEGIFEYKFSLVTIPMFIIVPVIFMIIVILVSAIIPSRRASRVSPIEAIRQNDDIKINKKKIKTNKLILKLFGVEGEIALKNIKRNKKKYRVTTISLFISIVLFISFSAYMNYTLNAASNMIDKPNYDIGILVLNHEEEIDGKVNEIMRHPDVIDYVKYANIEVPFKRTVEYTDNYIDYSKVRFSDDYDELFANNNYDYVSVIVFDDNSYNEYKKVIGLSEDKVILLNNFKGVTYGDGKRINYDTNVIKDGKVNLTMCNFSTLDEIPEDIDSYCNKNLNNVFVTDKSYSTASEISNISGYKLIMNKRIFDVVMSDYKEEYEKAYYSVNIVSDNYTDIDRLGSELSKYNGVYYTNIEESMKMQSNLILAIKILMYGFIALVTLIGVTSVFNTISTSMALRKREFAVLRSIGLTKNGFNKILFFESLFFGLKSLLYGLPVSFGVIYLIHRAMSGTMTGGAVMIPWGSIVITILFVFVIVLLTMLYSTNKIKKHNIIDEIREENI